MARKATVYFDVLYDSGVEKRYTVPMAASTSSGFDESDVQEQVKKFTDIIKACYKEGTSGQLHFNDKTVISLSKTSSVEITYKMNVG